MSLEEYPQGFHDTNGGARSAFSLSNERSSPLGEQTFPLSAFPENQMEEADYRITGGAREVQIKRS